MPTNWNAADNTDCQPRIVELKKVLHEFEKDLKDINLLIAYNIDFDYTILNCEFKKLNLNSKLNQLSRFCIIKTNEICLFCVLGRDGKKWSKLKELNSKLFGSSFANANSGLLMQK